jgi:hypothetical protein
MVVNSRTIAPTPAEIARFWSRVTKTSPEECWLWTGAKLPGGYGSITITSAGNQVGAHCVSVVLDGRDPTGSQVCHTCDTPLCVNPGHLRIASAAWNMQDKMTKGRHDQVRGSRHGMAKLDETAVRAVRLALAAGTETHQTIATRFGVTRSVVSNIKAGKRWAHLKI